MPGGAPGFAAGPSCVGTLDRDALHGVVARDLRGLFVLCAPAGYGKTVFASQIAERHGWPALWLNWDAIGGDPSRLMERVCAELAESGSCFEEFERDERQELCRKRACTASTHLGSWTLILDDVPEGFDPARLRDDLARLASHGPRPSLVLITTRETTADILAVLSPAAVVGSAHLAFSADEMRAILGSSCVAEVSDDDFAWVSEVSNGHPATVAVLARQLALGVQDREGSDIGLSAHLCALAKAQLDTAHMRSLVLVSMVSTGETTCLSESADCDMRSEIAFLASKIPLVRDLSATDGVHFRVHALAGNVYGSRRFVESVGLDFEPLLDVAIDALDKQGDFIRMFELARSSGDADRIVDLVLRRGGNLLESGGVEVLASILESVPARRTLLSPQLLIVSANVLREKMQFGEAMSKAIVARDLAEIEDDQRVLCDALMLLARLHIDAGSMAAALASLERLSGVGCYSRDMQVTCAAYMALCHAFLGDRSASCRSLERAQSMAAGDRIEPSTQVRVHTVAATIKALLDGLWADAIEEILKARGVRGCSAALAIQSDGNLGTALVETGRLGRAQVVLESAIASSERYGMRMLELSYRDSLALLHAMRADYDSAISTMRAAVAGCEILGDHMELSRQFAYLSMIARAAGRADEALEWAEQAMEESASLQCPWLQWMASIEVAASLLRQGDATAARRQAEWVRAECIEANCERYVLTADLVLAAAHLQSGEVDAAVARLSDHAKLIQSDHSVFLLVMYIRAFPLLLIAMSSFDAVSPRVCAHLSSMLFDAAAKSCLDEGNARSLRQWSARAQGLPGSHRPCRVKLFGGLEVRVGDRQVREKDWRKRKARLLFALMVLQRGRDMSREQVCDLLWPELDSERARNNFYVIWSIMKNALVPDGKKGAPLEYADNTGGLCRIDLERVDSDIEEFARCITSARDAESNGDSASALKCYHALGEVYRGDLLPGDVYEDFFASARDRYRMEFCDAMRRAVACAERLGDHAAALEFARRGLDTDPLSEDLYQAVMRSHIECGRRSAAIDAYFLCRQRLCDDLGLDPSSETMRLYDRILAMEENEPDPEMDG